MTEHHTTIMKTISSFILILLLLLPAYAQHGVIREYAALAPKSDAIPLPALFDALLTDTSITVGPDKAFYLTGSTTDRLSIWHSTDMKQWKRVRTLDFRDGQVDGDPTWRGNGGSIGRGGS
jgi:hypothetical protein